MSNRLFVSESTLTDRYQTTVPSAVRKALQLNKREKILYTIKPDGDVLISRADQEEADPVLDSFLGFLEKDMEEHPERLVAVTPEFVAHLQELVKDIDIDLDAPLNDEDEYENE